MPPTCLLLPRKTEFYSHSWQLCCAALVFNVSILCRIGMPQPHTVPVTCQSQEGAHAKQCLDASPSRRSLLTCWPHALPAGRCQGQSNVTAQPAKPRQKPPTAASQARVTSVELASPGRDVRLLKAFLREERDAHVAAAKEAALHGKGKSVCRNRCLQGAFEQVCCAVMLTR